MQHCEVSQRDVVGVTLVVSKGVLERKKKMDVE